MSKIAQADDKIKTIGQFTRKMQEQAVTQFRMMVAFDFSISNQWQNLHNAKDLSRNPYVQVMNALHSIQTRYVKNEPIKAFRFGCKFSEDYDCLPLCAPANPESSYPNIEAMTEGYLWAVNNIPMSGPTQFAPVFQKAVQVSAETQHKEMLVCIIITDGDVEDVKADCESLTIASNYPICFVAVGVGNGNFKDLEKFDDLKMRKFDNLQFTELAQIAQILSSTKCERPDLVLALSMFNEIPAAVNKMRKTGILK